MTHGITKGKDMTKTISINEVNLNHMKRAVEMLHPGKPYKITEYSGFYAVGITEKNAIIQPMLFNKKGAFPILKTFAQMSAEECKNPKVIFESGGQKDVKK